MKIVNTLNHHLHTKEGSVDQYVRKKRLALAEEIRPSIKIYLDTKFWLLLRDARLGKPISRDVMGLLGVLEKLVGQRKALCPFSVDLYAEFCKQGDPASLRATIKLVDDLSLGVSILEFGERFRLEALHFLREKTKGGEAVYPLNTLVWTKIAYFLGFTTPVNPDLSAQLDVAVQKAFVDQMWQLRFEDIYDTWGPTMGGRAGWFGDDITKQLNVGKSTHTHEYSSFKELFLNELAGVLDGEKPMLADLMQFLYQSETGKQPTPQEVANADAGRWIGNLIYNAFRLEKITTELPSFRISAGLHAAIRWDSKRKYKANDLHDIHHAVTAIPYFDWFFTEHSLRHLVTDNNLALESLFKCKTISEPSEALSAMSRY